MPRTIIDARQIHKIYVNESTEIQVLSGIDLNLKKGKSIAIKGASGKGKTTLLHILAGLEKPTKGSIYISDTLLNEANAAKIRNSQIGFIFQTYNLLEDFTVLENVLLPAKIARNSTASVLNRCELLLQEVNLEEKKNFSTKFLSGGEKQRVAIARSFCNDPEIVLADEPSGNLDSTNSKLIHNLLLNFVRKKNKSLIVATHDEELANLCDEAYILKDGLLHNI